MAARSKGPGADPRWATSARKEDLSLDAHGHFPGIQCLTTELAATERAGRVTLTGDDLSLDLSRLFPHPLRLDAATEEVPLTARRRRYPAE